MPKLAIGGYNDNIAVYDLDLSAGTAPLVATTPSTNASWLVPHPSAKDIWFSTSEVDPGAVRVFTVGENGGLTLVSVHPTGGIHPTHLAVSTDGQDLFVANYSSGDLSVLGILPEAPYLGIQDGSSVVQTARQIIPFAYVPPTPGEPLAGFNPSRQEGAHPHQVLVLPAPYNEVLVPDLGSDKVWRLQKTGSHNYAVRGYVPFSLGSGPRHAALVDSILYTVCELSNLLAAHRLQPLPQPAEPIAYVATLPTPASLAGASRTPGGTVLLPSALAYTSSVPPTPAGPDENEDPIAAANNDLALPPPGEAAGKDEVKEDQPVPALAAEILAPPPLTEGSPRLLYISNRNEIAPPHPEIGDIGGDTIAIFSLYPEFKCIKRVRTGVNHARGVNFTPDGTHLVVAGQNGGGVNLFKRDPNTGLLEFSHSLLKPEDVKLPTSITFVA